MVITSVGSTAKLSKTESQIVSFDDAFVAQSWNDQYFRRNRQQTVRGMRWKQK